jgi:hypothetical protein
MGKLTLSVDDRLIKLAKDWARMRGVSISQIVSTFFVSIGTANQPPDKMPPVLRKLAGILQDEEARVEDYHKHLEKKYL